MRRVRVFHSQSTLGKRCVYCRADDRKEALRDCRLCGSSLHRACLSELQFCPTIGCPASMAQYRARPKPIVIKLRASYRDFRTDLRESPQQLRWGLQRVFFGLGDALSRVDEIPPELVLTVFVGLLGLISPALFIMFAVPLASFGLGAVAIRGLVRVSFWWDRRRR